MTSLQFTPKVQIAPAVTADMAVAVRQAQAAGDAAYAFAERAGVSLPERSIAYLKAFAETMAELGAPLPCPYELCQGA
jgi:hypothetical protein